jgi:ABC-2 type transport system permease protein
MNYYGVKAIFIHELDRFKRTLLQSLASPIITTSLYFIVFGTAIGSRIKEIDGVNYGSYIVPGMIMLTILTQALSNASFAIYFQKFTSTIFEIHAAPLSSFEIILGFVGSAAVKSIIIGLIIIITAGFFVDIEIQHPVLMIFFLILTSITFSLFGFIVGIYADGFEGLQIIPILVITPLTFLGGSFYSISMLPDFWQTVSLFNPVLYLISGFRYSFYEVADVSVLTSIITIFTILICCILFITYTFIKGYKIKN